MAEQIGADLEVNTELRIKTLIERWGGK